MPTISKQSEIRLLLKTDKVRQQLFDNLQPNLQPTCNLLATLSRQAFSKSVLRPAMERGYIKMQYPDKPNSKNQKYQLTDLGIQILQALYEQERGNLS